MTRLNRIARNQAIKKTYLQLSKVTKLNKPLYSHEYMLAELSKQYYLATKTIEDILKERK
jgi:hypothetical protein